MESWVGEFYNKPVFVVLFTQRPVKFLSEIVIL